MTSERQQPQKPPNFAVVIPTVGRPSLARTLSALAASGEPRPRRIVLVDDRPHGACAPLPVETPAGLRELVDVVPGPAAGPAAARNTGWRAAPEDWIAFLDDDVVPGPAWTAELAADIAAVDATTAGTQGRITVPLPSDRKPTDWERCTAGLATARWITADMAYRRTALEQVAGFDERFPRAFREDADLALRVMAAGWTLTTGERRTVHPVRPASRWISVRAQAGNADDVLMNRIHGRDWWRRAEAARGRLPRHLAITGTAAAALLGALTGRRRAGALLGAVWLAGVAEFTLARLLPGPRTWDETVTLAVSSALIPPVATGHWMRAIATGLGTRTRPHPVGGARDAPAAAAPGGEGGV